VLINTFPLSRRAGPRWRSPGRVQSIVWSKRWRSVCGVMRP